MHLRQRQKIQKMLRYGYVMATQPKTVLQAQAIFFDLDGTLVDTELLWASAMV